MIGPDKRVVVSLGRVMERSNESIVLFESGGIKGINTSIPP